MRAECLRNVFGVRSSLSHFQILGTTWRHPRTARGIVFLVGLGFNTTTTRSGWGASPARRCRLRTPQMPRQEPQRGNLQRLLRPRSPPPPPRASAEAEPLPAFPKAPGTSPGAHSSPGLRGTGSPPRLPLTPLHPSGGKAEPGEPPSRGRCMRRGGLRTGRPRLARLWRPQAQWKIFRRPTAAARCRPRPFPPGTSARVPPSQGRPALPPPPARFCASPALPGETAA